LAGDKVDTFDIKFFLLTADKAIMPKNKSLRALVYISVCFFSFLLFIPLLYPAAEFLVTSFLNIGNVLFSFIFPIKNLSTPLNYEIVYSFYVFFGISALMLTTVLGLSFIQPLVIRFVHMYEKLEDQKVEEELSKVFSIANLKLPFFYVSDKPLSRIPFALGSLWGKGFFKYSVFLSREIFNQMNLYEIKALVLHSVSTQYLNHSIRSIVFGLRRYFLYVLGAFSVLVVMELAFQIKQSQFIVGVLLFLFIHIVSFVAASFFVKSERKKHVFEADAFAIKNGADPRALESALKKLQTSVNVFDRYVNSRQLDESSVAKRIAAIHKKAA
jgi:Zn-dependent protease with chaperone function